TVLAQAGSRVLLLDADLRHPRCHRLLGVDAARGLSSCLAGEVELESVLQALDAPPLSFIPAGPLTVAPAELVGSVRMRQALAELRSQYDFVIVDTPPVLPVTDAVVLATMADAVVLVVKGHATPRELVRHARDRLAMAGARLLGVVVNNVDLAWGDLYFYDDYYRDDQPPQAEARA
ncbi:MAG: CpsD/CapB family tyrosine-protein kinase, partial [Deltaproteobacteria bacterium]